VEGPRTTRLWDLPALPSFATVPQPLRVVWAEEQTRRRRIFGGIVGETVEGKRWIWVTDLSAAAVGAEKIQRWGRERWDLETRGFNELATLWYKDHRLIHHPPGDRSPAAGAGRGVPADVSLLRAESQARGPEPSHPTRVRGTVTRRLFAG
jgi:hypothetical protein